MIRYIYGHDLRHQPDLANDMFRDRATQFHDRLGWDVSVNAQGEERDPYDARNPLYVIWQDRAGRHQGSMRLLPTTGPTMVNDHFTHLTDGVRIVSPLIWESTRFCLAPGAPSHVAAALILAGGEVMQAFGIAHYVGVFDARMVRIYRRIGAEPEVLGQEGTGGSRVAVGLWEFNAAAQARVSSAAGISPEMSRHWFNLSFGARAGRLQGAVA